MQLTTAQSAALKAAMLAETVAALDKSRRL